MLFYIINYQKTRMKAKIFFFFCILFWLQFIILLIIYFTMVIKINQIKWKKYLVNNTKNHEKEWI